MKRQFEEVKISILESESDDLKMAESSVISARISYPKFPPGLLHWNGDEFGGILKSLWNSELIHVRGVK